MQRVRADSALLKRGTVLAYAEVPSIVELSFHARLPQAECERLTNCQQSPFGNAPSSGKGLKTQRSFG
jgi:hypothetical protein